MTSKTTTKANRNNSAQKSRKKPNRINRQRRLQKQLQILLLERHSRRCIICHHPEREAIEEEFVHWRAPWKLAQDYKLADYRTIYRHARAAGLLLHRRERLHSALDAFVESVDDVTFTGDTILRAMRAYSCIDDRGRWTEIPTQVQFSTNHDAHPPQPTPRSSNVDSNVIDIDADDESEEGEDSVLEEHVTASAALLAQPPAHSTSSKSMSRSEPAASSRSMSQSDNTACLPRASRGAASPAQVVDVREDDYADPENDDDMDDDPNHDPDVDPDDDNDPKNKSEARRREETTACLPRASRGADSPAQALPRDVLRGQNPNGRSPSGRTDCLPRASRGAASPAQALSVVDSDDEPDDEPEDDPNDDPDGDPDDDNDPKNKSGARRREETTACADSPAQALPRDVDRGQNPNDRPLSDRTDCLPRASRGAAIPPQPPAHSTSSKPMSRCDTTACAASPAQPASALALKPNNCGRSMTATACLPRASRGAASSAQALPRDVLRGQIPNDRSPSSRTDSASTMKNAACHAAHPNRSSG